MREFNDREKILLEAISKMDVGSILDYSIHEYLRKSYFTENEKRALIIDKNNKRALFYLSPNQMSDDSKYGAEIFYFFEKINLLSYLHEKRYVSIVPVSNPSTNITFLYNSGDNKIQDKGKIKILNSKGDFFTLDNCEYVYDKDKNIILKGTNVSEYYDLISKTFFGLILPTEELKDLVNHDFISSEDRKHKDNIVIAKRNLNYAKAGIITAWIIGLIGLFVPLLKKDSVVKINTQQYDSLMKNYEEGLNMEREILNNMNSYRPDSVKMKMKK